MTEREKSLREKLTERKSLLDDYFRSKYLSRVIDGRAFFQSKKGQCSPLIHLSTSEA